MLQKQSRCSLVRRRILFSLVKFSVNQKQQFLSTKITLFHSKHFILQYQYLPNIQLFFKLRCNIFSVFSYEAGRSSDSSLMFLNNLQQSIRKI